MDVKSSYSSQGKNVDCGRFENRILRKIFETEKEEVTGDWRNIITVTHNYVIIYTLRQILSFLSNHREKRRGKSHTVIS
jgi:hypothetical protein